MRRPGGPVLAPKQTLRLHASAAAAQTAPARYRYQCRADEVFRADLCYTSDEPMTWLPYALLSAVAAAATAILAKIGIAGVPSNLATAIRTVVILIFAWAIVIGQGQHHAIGRVSGRSWLFLALSGIATGISWLAYFRALQLGPASRVAPVDKLSLALTLVLASVLLRETITWKVGLGVGLMIAGALLTIVG
jgi:transporter family protein